jgi:hypothetical protein
MTNSLTPSHIKIVINVASQKDIKTLNKLNSSAPTTAFIK